MAVLKVAFPVPAAQKGLLKRLLGGTTPAPGQITIVDKGVHRFTNADVRPDETVTHPLQGNYFGFPAGMVKRVNVVATTNQDWPQFGFDVNGAEQGNFAGTVHLWQGNKSTPVRFDGVDAQEKAVFRTDYYNIEAELVEVAQPTTAAVSSPSSFLARIVNVTRGTHPSGDIPVVVTWQVDSVPQGTNALAMAFVTNQEWPQGRTGCSQPGEYSLKGHVWNGHSGIIGQPAGASVGIEAILRTTGGTPTEVRETFTLDRVK